MSASNNEQIAAMAAWTLEDFQNDPLGAMAQIRELATAHLSLQRERDADELKHFKPYSEERNERIALAGRIDWLPLKHEYWIGFDTDAYLGRDTHGEPKLSPRKFYRCHGCRKGSAVKTKCCPNCGAKMDGKEPMV